MKAIGATAVAVLVVIALYFAFAYSNPTEAGAATAKKELLVYCGITMIKPMSDIARVIEAEEGCTIILTKGGSGNLLRAIKVNKVGDLYLPGSDSYIKTAREEGLVTDTVFVGHNKAAVMVQKGNPKALTGNLENLANADYCVVIGNPDSGSIGRETRKILERRGIFDAVAHNARMLTTDSKDLVRVLRDREADLVVNWFATSTWPENRDHVDTLSIDGRYAASKRLVLGLLRTSKHPGIAKKFMGYAASEKGRALFQCYGLHDVE